MEFAQRIRPCIGNSRPLMIVQMDRYWSVPLGGAVVAATSVGLMATVAILDTSSTAISVSVADGVAIHQVTVYHSFLCSCSCPLHSFIATVLVCRASLLFLQGKCMAEFSQMHQGRIKITAAAAAT